MKPYCKIPTEPHASHDPFTARLGQDGQSCPYSTDNRACQAVASVYLMDTDSVLVVHLVKLINQADTLVCQDQSTTLQCPLTGDRVLLD